MKTVPQILCILTCLSVIFFSCQKEVSFETSDTVKSDGILQSDITGSCLGINVGGLYKKDTILNATHYVDVSIVVNAAGSYIISTDTLNGYYFRASGSFTATGSQIVRLKGNGKPLATGTNIFTVKYDSTDCEFSITVVGGTSGSGSSVFTLGGAPGNCTGATLNGTYEGGTATTSANTVDIQVNVNTIGTWSISTNPVNGVTFSGSGTFSSVGAQSITLNAGGTPAAAGDFDITVTVGSSSCSFILTIAPGITVDWKFTEGTSTYQGSFDDAQLSVAGGFTIFAYSGSSPDDGIVFGITDFAGGIQNNETYSSSSTTGNSAGFVFSGPTGMYTADNTTSGVNLIFKITSHNTTTKTIVGTFSGTVLNAANAVKTITNGQFMGTY